MIEHTPEISTSQMLTRTTILYKSHEYFTLQLHKTCKVIREFLYEDDEYEYSPKYQNISCVETEEDPFTISPPHADQVRQFFLFKLRY